MLEQEIEKMGPPTGIIYIIFAILAGLVLPLVLIPIAKLTGHSEILEEIAKALVVIFLILKLPNFKTKIITAIIFGLFFGLSENLLYLSQFIQQGNLSPFWQRFDLTVPMHVLTVLIIFFLANFKKALALLGLILAIAVHLLFNYFVSF